MLHTQCPFATLPACPFILTVAVRNPFHQSIVSCTCSQPMKFNLVELFVLLHSIHPSFPDHLLLLLLLLLRSFLPVSGWFAFNLHQFRTRPQQSDRLTAYLKPCPPACLPACLPVWLLLCTLIFKFLSALLHFLQQFVFHLFRCSGCLFIVRAFINRLVRTRKSITACQHVRRLNRFVADRRPTVWLPPLCPLKCWSKLILTDALLYFCVFRRRVGS